ncbi:hypothetical protein NLJ89_g3900 [Agrocybe chaxingu]|uniref:AAA protein C-terminal winged helix domain-containing protein n=1 Tax=Agrocybe chaxingu TaxID=84603 RepID=A0A9W8K4W3_9AGAR|nr:hypothetical protein NLJ89_g3900 [Agrocybe chaxingu]
MNKLEKVALRCARIRGKPLVLIINNVHFFQNNDDGKHMLLQLQQKAEAWAASGILTMVFSSDDFWPFHVMRQSASRMHVISIYDLDPRESARATKRIRRSAGRPAAEPEAAKEALSLIGGRLSYLNKVVLDASLPLDPQLKKILTGFKSERYGTNGKAFAPGRDRVVTEPDRSVLLHVSSGARMVSGSIQFIRLSIMAVFAELDRLNIISIDIQHNVRPDSNLILHAAQQVTEEEGFDELLQNVRDRIDEIESLHRTRELTFKDLDKGDMVRLAVDKRGEELLATVDDDDDS